ncbi:MAG: TolC family protein [Candidatus Krumholzibacteriota bacterium]
MKNLIRIMAIESALLFFISPAGAETSAALPAAGDTLRLSLDRSIAMALKNNRDIKIAREKILESEERLKESRTSSMPKLTGEANYTRLDMAPFFPAAMFGGFGSPAPGEEEMPKKIVIGSPNNYSLSLNLTQPIFTFGKIMDQCDISEFARDAAVSDLRARRNQLIFETVQSYWSLYNAMELKEVAVESARMLSSQLQDLENLYENGLAARNDMLKTRALLSESHLGLIQANNSIELAQKNLCDMLGLPLSSAVRLTEKPSVDPGPSLINLDKVTAEAVNRRPEIAAVENQLNIAGKQYTIDRKAYLPDISFFANLGYNRPDRQYLDEFYTTWTMGVVARMNIFDWGAAAHRAGQSNSRRKQLELELEKIREAVKLDVARALLQLTETKQSVSASEEALRHARENYRVADQKFTEGIINNTELLDAQLILTRARANHRNSLARYLVARSNLERAAGKLIRSPETE